MDSRRRGSVRATMAGNGAEEIEIAAPWGKIAAKAYGRPTSSLVLLLHGAEDNAGSFDGLVPLLATGYYCVSADLPGHGRSDALPGGGPALHASDYLRAVSVLVDSLARGAPCAIVGHSFGAALGLLFALAYPERLTRLYMIDTLWFASVEPCDFPAWTRSKLESLVRATAPSSSGAAATLTYEEAVDVVSTHRWGEGRLTGAAAEALLRRGLREVAPGRYAFARDPRARDYVGYAMDERYVCEMLGARELPFRVVCVLTERGERYCRGACPRLLGAFREVAEVEVVAGDHHVHLNEPRVVADIVNRTLDDAYPV